MSVCIEVRSISGETLLGPLDLDAPTAASVLQRVPETCHLDQLLQGDVTLAPDALLQATEGGAATVLTLVRVKCGLAKGMEDSLVESLLRHGVFSNKVPGFEGLGLCLLLPMYDHNDQFTEDVSLILLVPDGRILAKTRHEYAYLADCELDYRYEIAEGRWTDGDESGNVQIEWSGWAEKKEELDEPPANFRETPWAAKLIDQAKMRMPGFVPANAGTMNLPEICTRWLENKESPPTHPNWWSEPTLMPFPKQLVMNKLTKEMLEGLGLTPDHLAFWLADGSGTQSVVTTRSDGKQRVLDTFHAWNTDGNGKITQDELIQIFRDINSGFSNSEIVASFKHLDKDGKKHIDVNEFVAWVFKA